MGDLLVRILDFIFGMLTGMASNGELSSAQAIFVVFFAVSLLICLWKIKEIIEFLKGMKNAKLDEYNRMLENYPLPDIDQEIIELSISNIIRYRISGISDVAMQSVVFRLLSEEQELISPSFFKKFRTFLSMKDGVIVFNKGLGFRFECFMYGFLSVQYLLLAFLFMALSIYKGDAISLWQHLTLYTMIAILFMMFIAFGKMIPLPKECRLMSEILQKQNTPPPSSD
ncbi:TPA: hypothetical protein ACSTJX_003346 [Serratia fonticola]